MRVDPNPEIGRGGTGDPPVSSGHSATRAATQRAYNFACGFPFPPHFYFRVVSWLIYFGVRVVASFEPAYLQK
jgi:hypothetical protein